MNWLKDYDKKINAIKHKNSRSIHILVTLQTYITKHLVYLLMPVMKKASADLFWWFREQSALQLLSKQVNVEQILRKNKIINFNVKDATEIPLGALLRNIDVNITINSSTVIDAESFGIPSIVTHEEGGFLFPDQFENGIAVHAQTPEGIENAIQAQFEKRSQKRDRDGKQMVKGESNGMEKLLDLIEART